MALIKCEECGQMVSEQASTCPHCGASLKTDSTSPAQQAQQTIYVNTEHRSNGLGIAGMVLAILAFFLGWVPVLGWILWALGAIFSFIGLFKSPRGTAIAGFIISFIGLILIIAVGSAIAALIGLSL
ncbi:MAG: zinc ribbon domain-containing protein [Prevotellaceae bacterium]|nr:zinc ribbon domain-containing protein [Prevotellaceae bacterium]